MASVRELESKVVKKRCCAKKGNHGIGVVMDFLAKCPFLSFCDSPKGEFTKLNSNLILDLLYYQKKIYVFQVIDFSKKILKQRTMKNNVLMKNHILDKTILFF